MLSRDEAPLSGCSPDYSEDGVDLTLIRWMLSLTPLERLQVLQQHLNAIAKIRDANPDLWTLPIDTPLHRNASLPSPP